MNTQQLDYLQAMGIQSWQLKKAPSALKLMVIGTSPDDKTPAGQLLYKMLQVLEIDNLCITSVHVALGQQISSAMPQVLLAMGNAAAQYLLNSPSSLDLFRDKVHEYGATHIPLIITYDPDHLLQHPIDKRKAFQDLQLTLRTLQAL